MPFLYLASSSPRRRELLQQIGVNFNLLKADIDETPLPDEAPADYVQRLALLKAQAGFELLSDTDAQVSVVLGGDTAVVCEGLIFGKPVDRDDALSMLGSLSGKTHQVYSAVSLVDKEREVVRLSITDVTFELLTAQQCEDYWDTGEPRGKAGAYAIQGFGGVFVKSIKGSYSAVVGLPIAETAAMLMDFGVPIWGKSSTC